MVDFFGALGGFGSDIFSGIFKGLYFGLLLGCAIGAAYYILRLRKYDHIVRVFEKDSMNNVIEKGTDKGGIFLDRKTQYRLFLLKKLKIGLRPDQVPYILSGKGKKVVYLYKAGLKNYQYMTPQLSTNPGLIFNVHDEDVAWALNAWEKFKIPNKHDLLKQILPYIGVIITGIIILMMIYTIVKQGGPLYVDAANAFKEATANLAKANLGSTVVN